MRPEDHLRELLGALGFVGDPEMEGTPERVVEMLRGFVPSDPPPLTAFPAPRGDGSNPVILRDVPFHSLCAHHLLPFFGTASVAYLPRDKVAGFGSLAGAIQHFAARPQIQERMAEQLADHLVAALGPHGVVVRLVARQLCMEMRGARSPGEAEVWARRGVDLERFLRP